MEQKTIRFDLSADRLLDLADAKLDEGDPLGALRLIHKSLDLYGPAADEYAALADTYEEMELFELSAAAWFQYLDVCAEEEVVDGYEGLSACFYNLGNEGLASYYYKKMLADKYVTPENNMEMGELFEHAAAAQTAPRVRITWPPEHADYSQELDAGLRLLRKGDHEGAEREFLKIHPGSSYYAEACNYLAVSYLLSGKTDKAEECCLAALKEKPDSVQTLATYAAVLSEMDRKEESARIAHKLSLLPAEEPDELYKIATVCCENGLYEAAYEKFCKLEKIVGYDRTMLYFKGVAAFRCGKVKECLASFGKILDIRPNAAVVRYYFRQVRRWSEEGGAKPEMSFFCHIPDAEREKRVTLLKELDKMRPADARAYFQEDDSCELLEWCFDESDGREFELQMLAVSVALRAGQEWFVSGILLDPEVNDLLKVETVRRICRRNKGVEFGAVIANIYRKCAFDRLEVGREKHAKFLDAYALCFARFTLLGDADAERFRLAAQAVYGALEESEKLDLVKDTESLACVIFFTAVGGGDGKDTKRVLQSMNADPQAVAEILGTVRSVFALQAEAAAADAREQKEEAQEAKPEDGGEPKGEDGNETH